MWIKDLADYYKRGKPSDIQVKMLVKVYGNNDTATLQAAAELYMAEQNFFPSVADFGPYVDIASFKEATKAPRHYGLTDEDRFAIEVKRGTMRPLADIVAEIEADRIKLAAIHGKVEVTT